MLSQAHLLQDIYADLHLWTHTVVTLPEASRSAVRFSIPTNGWPPRSFLTLYEGILQGTGHALTNACAARYLF